MTDDFAKFLEQTYGYPKQQWVDARAWITRRLHAVARSQGTLTYSDLCAEAGSHDVIDLEPHGTPLAGMLGQINVLEEERGRPLISCVVVHKSGDLRPGVGFWNMAKEMGLDIGTTEDERDTFWSAELTNCYAYWKGRV